jgi:plastocyanin
MDGDFFFVLGIVLVIAAVALAFVGVRGADWFPPNRAVLVGGTALFVAVVAATMAFAIVKSEDEQSKRNEELAKEAQTTAETGTQAAIPAETLSVSSPADGALVFEPSGLEAKPGNLAIDYDNPSPVPHSIAVATANGNVLGETQPAAGTKETLQVPDLKPGKYIFYCTVPGHREAGMEGNLTVTGGPTP